MADLSLQDHLDFTAVAADAAGDDVPQGSRGGGWDLPVVLYVNNGDASAHTVTTSSGDYAVPAGAQALVPVHGIYNGSNQTVTYDAVTSVTVAAISLIGV